MRDTYILLKCEYYIGLPRKFIWVFPLILLFGQPSNRQKCLAAYSPWGHERAGHDLRLQPSNRQKCLAARSPWGHERAGHDLRLQPSNRQKCLAACSPWGHERVGDNLRLQPSNRQKCLAACSPWATKEPDTTGDCATAAIRRGDLQRNAAEEALCGYTCYWSGKTVRMFDSISFLGQFK